MVTVLEIWPCLPGTSRGRQSLREDTEGQRQRATGQASEMTLPCLLPLVLKLTEGSSGGLLTLLLLPLCVCIYTK